MSKENYSVEVPASINISSMDLNNFIGKPVWDDKGNVIGVTTGVEIIKGENNTVMIEAKIDQVSLSDSDQSSLSDFIAEHPPVPHVSMGYAPKPNESPWGSIASFLPFWPKK